MTGPQASRSYADRLIRLGRLGFGDFAYLDDCGLRAALGPVDPAALAPLLIRYPELLRRLRRACPEEFGRPTSQTSPTGLTYALVRTHAFELLAAKLPALYETLPWFDWDPAVVLRGRPLWRTRLLLAGDSATVTAARCRRAGGVKLVEPRARPAEYARRKLALAGVKRYEVNPGSLVEVVRSGGFDLAVLALPFAHGPGPEELFACLTGPALVLALRPGAEAEIRPPAGWTGIMVRTMAGPRPGWSREELRQ